jgi:hypothetical protein
MAAKVSMTLQSPRARVGEPRAFSEGQLVVFKPGAEIVLRLAATFI